ncbi:three-Cys-motif partner protein TcmP [Micromonospora sp. NPDC000663]|uniref:three-Cys-motif partner protein TcmP n=1 Tax=Micromonospora sp. NPDC000663 TaxID=3364218 RepID=UPI0036C43853
MTQDGSTERAGSSTDGFVSIGGQHRMPPPQDTLWRSQPRVLIKHQVYRHYLQCWMGKICRSFDQSSIVDAFSGPGQYLDGPDGSPLVISKTFLEHSAFSQFNTLRFICNEKRADRREHLTRKMKELPPSPKLKFHSAEPAGTADTFEVLDALAHGGSRKDIPTLWILDPFNLAGVPFELIQKCLRRSRDEVLITWFSDEIYRFCEDSSKANAMSSHFGGDHWKSALEHKGETARKEALLTAYQDGLRSLGVLTNAVSISSRNETARYSLVFATHDDRGLECFNPVKWRLDPVKGSTINENRGMQQGDLFSELPVVEELRAYLESLAGEAASFLSLVREAQRMGYLEKHLRTTLDELAVDGRAVRETPLKASTRWPAESVIRFYPPA